MSALAIDTPPSVKDRLIGLLSALEYGLYPPDGCGACRDAQADRCEAHERAAADMATASQAVSAVQDADGDDAARLVFMAAIAGLAGETRYGIASGVIVTAGGAR